MSQSPGSCNLTFVSVALGYAQGFTDSHPPRLLPSSVGDVDATCCAGLPISFCSRFRIWIFVAVGSGRVRNEFLTMWFVMDRGLADTQQTAGRAVFVGGGDVGYARGCSGRRSYPSFLPVPRATGCQCLDAFVFALMVEDAVIHVVPKISPF